MAAILSGRKWPELVRPIIESCQNCQEGLERAQYSYVEELAWTQMCPNHAPIARIILVPNYLSQLEGSRESARRRWKMLKKALDGKEGADSSLARLAPETLQLWLSREEEKGKFISRVISQYTEYMERKDRPCED